MSAPALDEARRRPRGLGAFADRRLIGGFAALSFAALVVGGAFGGLLVEAFGGSFIAGFDAYLVTLVRFTLWQAILSTLVSVAPAIVVARALHRQQEFPGRSLLLGLFAVPVGLPALVGALGILALLGRAGLLAGPLSVVGGESWPGIYGLGGILVAHAFFNLPLAARLLLGALEEVPADQWRLGSQLGFSAGQTFRLLEWPALRASLPGIASLVFMLCVTSFTIVLTLGGGPAATTLEVAIYQSLRFDFDPARAAVLTAVQVMLTLAVLLVLSRLGTDVVGETASSVSSRRFTPGNRTQAVADLTVILLAFVFVVAPLLAILWSGLQADLSRLLREMVVQKAIGTSLVLAGLSGLVAVALSWALASARYAASQGPRSTHRLLDGLFGAGASLVLVVPPVVIGAGWFLLLRGTGQVFAVAPIMVVAVNALMALPFAARVIRPAHDAAALRHDRLCRSLGISGLDRLRLVDWPALRRPLFTALAFAMALSLGDLGVIALFGSDAVQTLPYLLLGRMGSYRTADATGLALLLGCLCLGLMLLSNLLGRERSTS